MKMYRMLALMIFSAMVIGMGTVSAQKPQIEDIVRPAPNIYVIWFSVSQPNTNVECALLDSNLAILERRGRRTNDVVDHVTIQYEGNDVDSVSCYIPGYNS